MKAIIGLLLMLVSVRSWTQEIEVTVLDEQSQPMISAAVLAYKGGVLKGASVTNYDGNCVIKPLDTGYYSLIVLYSGYDSLEIKGIVLTQGNSTSVLARMKPDSNELRRITILWTKPLAPNRTIITLQDIRGGHGEPKNVVALAPEVYRDRLRQPHGICGIVRNGKGRSLRKVNIALLRKNQVTEQTTTTRDGCYVMKFQGPDLFNILATRSHYDSLFVMGDIGPSKNDITINVNLQRAHGRAKCDTVYMSKMIDYR